MPAVNAVEPMQRSQDLIDMEREMASLRRQLEEAQREAGQVASLRRQLEEAKREANQAASLRRQLEEANRGATRTEKQLEDMKAKLASETKSANNYWACMKRLRKNNDVMTAMLSNSSMDMDDSFKL
ncbi:unnamed protein product [Cylicocyclus nassatus]|uniref:Uncharacterized protein n=1 Tax=Cylicocyclus nassatus TaxID=53992 RepID=A0AA36M2N1_CYLNA|nr:unnamed protein product [Cylicocyclus nassatus]